MSSRRAGLGTAGYMNQRSDAREIYTWVLDKYVVPQFGARPISEIDTGDIAAWLRGLEAEGKKSALVAKVKTVASALFQGAAEDKSVPGVTINPVRGIKLKRQAKVRRKAFTQEQNERFRAELGDHWCLVLDLITDTGVRWEEAHGLQKSDLEGNALWVGNVLNELNKPHHCEYLPRTKTGKGRQVLVRESMAERIRERPDGFTLLRPGRQHAGKCGEYCTDEAHIRVDYFRKNIWHPALEAVGLAGSGLVPHDLRRTHATWLRDNGVLLEVVQQRLGHGSLTTTQVYLGEIRSAEQTALAAVN